MTIQDLGSIGELIAAVATVATLLYLAAQIRHNTNSVNVAAGATFREALHRITTVLAERPELAKIYFAGLERPDGLDATQMHQFINLLGMFSQYFDQVEELEAAGLASPAMIHSRDSQLSWIVTQPGFHHYLKVWGSSVHPDFLNRARRGIAEFHESGAQPFPTRGPGIPD